jgi:hypothetical protein
MGYNGIIDEVTGGTVRISGRHIDNTVKYTVNSEHLGAAEAISANRAVKEIPGKSFGEYWTSEKLENHLW